MKITQLRARTAVRFKDADACMGAFKKHNNAKRKCKLTKAVCSTTEQNKDLGIKAAHIWKARNVCVHLCVSKRLCVRACVRDN